MSILIQGEKLFKSYRMPTTVVHVLCGADLTVSDGQTVAVVGKSGAGKSTLLHVLGTLDRPEKGRVLIDGQDLYALPARMRTRFRSSRLGFVFQSYHLLPEMDVLENVMLPAMARRGFLLAVPASRRRALDLLGAVGLKDRADHMPFELSGGEQQRVALARALMNDPEIVLADEPTGNLDMTTGGQILEILFELTRQRGHALVMVTHNEEIASRCDRVLLLKDGLLLDG